MESNEFLLSLPPFLRRHLVPLSLGVVGLLLIVLGSVPLIFSPKNESSELVFEAGSTESASSTQQSVLSSQGSSGSVEDKSVASGLKKGSNTITIDVSGAVASPGVIILASDSRVQDAVKAVGGLTDKANNEWIAKNLNLAAKLSDAAKLYIPFIGEQGMTSGDINSGGSMSNVAAAGQGGGLININTATQAQIEALPGIGPVTAAKIINGRPYGVVEDLMTKKVVGQSVFEKIKEQVAI